MSKEHKPKRFTKTQSPKTESKLPAWATDDTLKGIEKDLKEVAEHLKKPSKSVKAKAPLKPKKPKAKKPVVLDVKDTIQSIEKELHDFLVKANPNKNGIGMSRLDKIHAEMLERKLVELRYQARRIPDPSPEQVEALVLKSVKEAQEAREAEWLKEKEEKELASKETTAEFIAKEDEKRATARFEYLDRGAKEMVTYLKTFEKVVDKKFNQAEQDTVREGYFYLDHTPKVETKAPLRFEKLTKQALNKLKELAMNSIILKVKKEKK